MRRIVAQLRKLDDRVTSNRYVSQNRFGVSPLVLTGIGILLIFSIHSLIGVPRAGAALPAVEQSSAASMAPVSAASRFMDVHTHLDPVDVEGSAQSALQAMGPENAIKIFFLPSPFTMDDPGRFDFETILPSARKHPGKFVLLGGGGTLNAMIQQSVKSGDAGPEIQRAFKERAEEILRGGAVGFGEMTAEHFASATAYQYAPPDHPLFLMLADIAAQHNVPIDLHMEAVPQDMPLPGSLKSPPNPPQLHANIAGFERLLAHNPRAEIVWDHAGSDNTGYRTPDLCRRLLMAHSNLYMELKIDPLDLGKNSPLVDGASGPIKADWLKLIQDFPGRFLIGSDQHYAMPKTGPQRWQAVILLFNQLPDDIRAQIGIKNPIAVYHPGRLERRKSCPVVGTGIGICRSGRPRALLF